MSLSLWMLLAAAALLLRAGQGLYLAGIARSKNVASTGFRSVAETAIGILAFWAVGAAIFDFNWHELVGIRGQLSVWMPFVAALCLVPTTIVTGATLERSRQRLWVTGALLCTGILAPLNWHLAWSPWFEQIGFHDLGGATFLHLTGGTAALIAAMLLGPRNGKYNRDGSTNNFPSHSAALISAGMLLMLAAWGPCLAGFFLLRTGNTVEFNAILAERLAFNAVLAGAAGACAAMIVSQLRYRKLDVLLVYFGMLGGLVSVTAGADRLSELSSVVIGGIAGILIPWVSIAIDLTMKIDDPGGGIAVHGMGGLWGAIAAAILAPGDFAWRLHAIGGELAGIVMLGAIALIGAIVVLGALRFSVGLRVREADEYDGLDLAEHDINAYPDFQQTLIKSHHLREM